MSASSPQPTMPELYTSTRIFTTPTVHAWGTPRVCRMYNHPLPTTVLDRLDPHGLHVSAAPSFLHEAGRFAKATSVRTFLLLKLRDQEQPLKIWLDIPLDDWNRAPSFEQVGAMLDALIPQEDGDAAQY